MEAKNQMDHPTPQQIDRPYPASDTLRREIEILDETPEVTPQPASPEKRKLYLPVKGKFFISTVFACVWISASWYLAQHWLAELAQVVGEMPAAVIVFFIALLPGFLNAHILSSVILDRPPKLRLDVKFPQSIFWLRLTTKKKISPKRFEASKTRTIRARSRSSWSMTAPSTTPSRCFTRSIYPI